MSCSKHFTWDLFQLHPYNCCPLNIIIPIWLALHYFLDSVVFGYPIFFLLTKRFMIGIVQILDYLSNGVLKIIIDTTRVQMYSWYNQSENVLLIQLFWMNKSVYAVWLPLLAGCAMQWLGWWWDIVWLPLLAFACRVCYAVAGVVVRSCAQLIYSRINSRCLLPQLVDRLVLPLATNQSPCIRSHLHYVSTASPASLPPCITTPHITTPTLLPPHHYPPHYYPPTVLGGIVVSRSSYWWLHQEEAPWSHWSILPELLYSLHFSHSITQSIQGTPHPRPRPHTHAHVHTCTPTHTQTLVERWTGDTVSEQRREQLVILLDTITAECLQLPQQPASLLHVSEHLLLVGGTLTFNPYRY